MIVICKRFSMDDVPVKVVKTWNQANKFCGKRRRMFATKRDEYIAGSSIGHELISYLCVEFDARGNFVKCEIVGAETI